MAMPDIASVGLTIMTAEIVLCKQCGQPPRIINLGIGYPNEVRPEWVGKRFYMTMCCQQAQTYVGDDVPAEAIEVS